MNTHTSIELKIVDLRVRGYSRNKISAELKIGHTKVQKIITKHGLNGRLSYRDRNIAYFRLNGYSRNQISKKLGLGYSTVQRSLNKLKLSGKYYTAKNGKLVKTRHKRKIWYAVVYFECLASNEFLKKHLFSENQKGVKYSIKRTLKRHDELYRNHKVINYHLITVTDKRL